MIRARKSNDSYWYVEEWCSKQKRWLFRRTCSAKEGKEIAKNNQQTSLFK